MWRAKRCKCEAVTAKAAKAVAQGKYEEAKQLKEVSLYVPWDTQ